MVRICILLRRTFTCPTSFELNPKELPIRATLRLAKRYSVVFLHGITHEATLHALLSSKYKLLFNLLTDSLLLGIHHILSDWNYFRPLIVLILYQYLLMSKVPYRIVCILNQCISSSAFWTGEGMCRLITQL